MGFLNIEGLENSQDDLSNYLRTAVDSGNNSRNNISKLKNLASDPDGYKKNMDLVKQLGEDNNKLVDSLGNVLLSSYNIQSNATQQAQNASTYLDNTNEYLGELVDDTNNEIKTLKIQKDNKKRIIEMQRNRLFKYQYIKKTLLYLIILILICGVILYLEKIFKSIKPISSVLLIILGVVSSIFFIFRGVDYLRRSKFNFKQYDIYTGGDRYKKTVYEYDRDEIQNVNDYAINEVGLELQSGMKGLQHGIKHVSGKMKHKNKGE